MPVHGREGFKQYVVMYRSVFPDLHFTLEDMVAAGENVGGASRRAAPTTAR